MDMVNLEQGAFALLHCANRKVEALVHTGIANVPPDRALLDLLVEITNQSWSLVGLLVEEVDHVHILLELIACLLSLGPRSVLLAVVQLLTSVRPNSHLASDNHLFLAPHNALGLEPVRLRIRVAVTILLDPELPHGAVRRKFLQPRSNVTDDFAAKPLPILPHLVVYMLQHQGCVLVVWVVLD